MGLSIVLLAAGQGKRMKTTKPKPLVELADKPLIQYSIDASNNSNVEDKIKAYLSCHERDRVPDQDQLFHKNINFLLRTNPGSGFNTVFQILTCQR